MRYMLLIHMDAEAVATMTREEFEDCVASQAPIMDRMAKQGVFVDAAPLQPSTTATTLRLRGDQVALTDGPFSETKEQLAGYYIVDCKDLDEAIAWAGQLPILFRPGWGASVEIRPFRDFPENLLPRSGEYVTNVND
jgi:hypothetical protein